jgi:pimeloyl-ACP methyl ester carboxylesterase
LAFGAALLCFALLGPNGRQQVEARQPSPGPERPMVFVPGLLGSMLCRTGDHGEQIVVWGTLDALGQFPSLELVSTDELEPCGLIREVAYLGIFSQTVYGSFIDRLERAGYREGETLFIFDYDWRLSIFDNAGRLAEFIEQEIPRSRLVDIVGHSMGGLIARTYALNEGEGRISRLVSAGTPLRGSVQVFELLHGGFGLATPLLGGIETFRRTVTSFPSTFELLPSYAGCCGSEQTAAFDALSAEAWAELNWTGIEEGGLADFADVARRQTELQDIVARPLPAGIEEAFVIGVDQRTAQRYQLWPGDGEARLEVRTSWDGDGTVMRDSAQLQDRMTYPTSFATHDALLNDVSVQDFIIMALAEGPGAAVASVPVRERTSILTAIGEFVELVGVSVATDQPIYATGTRAKLIVRLRLEDRTPVEAAALATTITWPDGHAAAVTLGPDPEASDPTNPFEQSFSAWIETGTVPGEIVIAVSLAGTGPDPREARRVVAVVAP